MDKVNINRKELLEIVRQNATKHMIDYQDDVVKYKALVLSILKENADHVVADELDKLKPIPSKPSNYKGDYNRAIRMLELSTDEVIQLSEKDFNNLVLDEWHWKNGLLMEKLRYTA
jgi:hypothetical protein